MMRLRRTTFFAAALPAIALAACGTYPDFAFPVEQGDIDAGRQAFIDLQCNQCHSVAGERIPQLGAAPPMLELGGETSQVKAYSELVTSIINPNHRISERYIEERRRQGFPVASSPMTPHIDTMTVRQLIDLVAFLDSRYILIPDYIPGIDQGDGSTP